MRRFLATSVSESPAKKAKVEVHTAAVVGTLLKPTRTPLLFSPTLLNHEDIMQAKTTKVNQWVVYSGIMYKLSGATRSYTDMVAFDMDGCLIATKSGKTFPINEQDWKLWDPSVKSMLQKLHHENKYLAIISNQSQLKDKKNSKEAFQQKIDGVIAALGVPIDFICAIGEDRFRKPRTGMWEFLCEARGISSGATTDASAVANASTSSTSSASSIPLEITAVAVVDAVVEESNSTDDEYSPKKRRHPSSTLSSTTTSTTTSTTSSTTTTTTSKATSVTAPITATTTPAVQSTLSQRRFTYVGDAAGRPKEGTRGKDHSDSDYKLALNVGIEFYTPEQFFHASTARLHCQLPDPGADVSTPLRMVDVARPTQELSDSFFLAPERRTPADTLAVTDVTEATVDTTLATAWSPEVVLLAAPPACGKSTLARRFEQGGYVRVNQDTLGSCDKCLAAARAALLNRRSVCVDNTNMDAKTRARWVQLAKEMNVQIRALVLNTSKDVCGLLSTYRMLDPHTPEGDRRKIERIVINTYFKAPIYPAMSEGFNSVETVHLDLVPPTDPQALRLFHMYLK